MTSSISILLADDHQIVLDGLQEILEAEPGFTIAGRATSTHALRRQAVSLCPDLILLDLNMPERNALEVLGEIKQQLPSIKVLVLTMYDSPEIVRRAFEAGADGYLLKDHGQDTLLQAIREVLAGRRFVRKRAQGPETTPDPMFRDAFFARALLSDREKEVLRLVARSNTNREIGAALFISEHTAATHRRNLKRKLNARDTAELIRFAYEQGLL